MRHRTVVDDAVKRRMHALYVEGMNDEEIAWQIGCVPLTVFKWRHACGLPANKRSRAPRPKKQVSECKVIKPSTVETLTQKEAATRRALLIAAGILHAQGVCRRKDPEKCKHYGEGQAFMCQKCLENWLLLKARRELNLEK